MRPDGSTLRNRLDAMVEKGASRFDPVRFSYIESLTRRAARMPEAIRQQLEKRAADALADYEVCFERAEKEAEKMMGEMASAYPEAMAPLQRLYSEKDFRGIARMSRRLRRSGPQSPLRLLIEQISGENRHGTEMLLETDNPPGRNAGPLHSTEVPGLKSYQLFRETWARHYSDRLVTDAAGKLPENPGPLNSQMLITRSLMIMRSLSPNYLKRFVSHVDTLLWLENAAGKPISPDESKT